MDGKARFAKISFVGGARINIIPLIDFPRQNIDSALDATPEADICVTQSGKAFYIADISTRKTKSFFAGLDWRWDESIAMILDNEKGFVYIPFFSEEHDEKTKPYYNIIYDPKNDKVIYESPEGGESISLLCELSSELALSVNWIEEDNEIIIFNWKTREIIKNKLTKKLTNLGTRTIIGPYQNISIKERSIFADIRMPTGIPDKKVKITWDENYDDVKVIPLDYLVPVGKHFYDFYFSTDEKWVTSFTGYYNGVKGEYLYKRVFFHLDNCYPNGISIPIFANDYYGSPSRFGSFVEHPEYGMCFAEEKHIKNDNGKEELYLRLYKMSDVLTEINRQLLENAKGVLKK